MVCMCPVSLPSDQQGQSDLRDSGDAVSGLGVEDRRPKCRHSILLLQALTDGLWFFRERPDRNNGRQNAGHWPEFRKGMLLPSRGVVSAQHCHPWTLP